MGLIQVQSIPTAWMFVIPFKPPYTATTDLASVLLELSGELVSALAPELNADEHAEMTLGISGILFDVIVTKSFDDTATTTLTLAGSIITVIITKSFDDTATTTLTLAGGIVVVIPIILNKEDTVNTTLTLSGTLT